MPEPRRLVRRRLDGDVYSRAITVLYGTIEQINHVLRTECPVDHQDIRSMCNGHWRLYPHNGYEADYLCIRRGLTRTTEAAVVGHEAAHVTFHALRFAGLKLTEESEEAFCYYHQWIVRNVLVFIDGHRR